jgi:hypothetical protein
MLALEFKIFLVCFMRPYYQTLTEENSRYAPVTYLGVALAYELREQGFDDPDNKEYFPPETSPENVSLSQWSRRKTKMPQTQSPLSAPTPQTLGSSFPTRAAAYDIG